MFLQKGTQYSSTLWYKAEVILINIYFFNMMLMYRYASFEISTSTLTFSTSTLFRKPDLVRGEFDLPSEVSWSVHSS